MGWVWGNSDDDNTNLDPEFRGSTNPYTNGNTGHSSTRKVVSSQCRTEEVEPGKFIRKCQKTEQLFKFCIGRPSELIQSNKEYTEEDVTDQMTRGSFPFESEDHGPLSFPGLRSDLEAIHRSFIDDIDRFLQAAEGMRNGIFNLPRFPHIYDNDSPSHKNHGIFIEDHPPKEAFPKKKSDGDGDVDLSGLAREV